jgi:PAP2 superfamily protein
MRPRKPPPGRHSPTEPAFPSGHALQTAGVAWTTAYVLVREGIAPPGAVVPLALLLPAVSGMVKLWRDRHWFTDVIGGYLLGATLAASGAAGYEIARVD